MRTLTVVAAYGRRYTHAYKAIQDWYCGKDFQIVGGPYISERDTLVALADGFTHLQIIDEYSEEVLAVLYLSLVGLQPMGT